MKLLGEESVHVAARAVIATGLRTSFGRQASAVARVVTKYGYRGVRVGEASHPGPPCTPVLKALRRAPRACAGCTSICKHGWLVHSCSSCGKVRCHRCGPEHCSLCIAFSDGLAAADGDSRTAASTVAADLWAGPQAAPRQEVEAHPPLPPPPHDPHPPGSGREEPGAHEGDAEMRAECGPTHCDTDSDFGFAEYQDARPAPAQDRPRTACAQQGPHRIDRHRHEEEGRIYSRAHDTSQAGGT